MCENELKEERKSKKIYYGTIIIAFVIMLSIGVTYAWFTSQVGNNPNLTTVGTLQIKYNQGSYIDAENLKPATKSQVLEAYTDGSCVYEGDREQGYTSDKICAYNTFTITNTGTLYAKTDISIKNIVNTYSSNIKYMLFETTPEELIANNLKGAIILEKDILIPPKANNSKTYTLLIWLDENADNYDMNKKFSGNIYAEAIETNMPNLDKSKANAPVLADGMIPIYYKYKTCGELDNPTEETYPNCYEYTANSINETDWNGMLNDMCVGEWKYTLEECTTLINNLKASNDDGYGRDINTWVDWYILGEFTMTSQKNFLQNKIYSYDGYAKADNNNEDVNNKWYDYENKMWANAVMVKTDATSGVEGSKSRSEYMNASVGTEIKEEDILAYYVWIPRYKYQLFNVDFNEANYSGDLGTSGDYSHFICTTNCPQVIDVVFEKGTSTTGTVTCTHDTNGNETCTNKENGKWYTHPAFTFGTEELEGIWVGKFEVSGSASAPRIKPGVTSSGIITITNMYSASKLFSSADFITTNGINQSDSHMMKNIEWGAVAYLKQSNYGLGLTDIAINDNSSFYTGGGSGTSYKTNTRQSTTGNITGVYDMSGGADEYVMGNYNKTSGKSGLTISAIPTQHIDIYSGDGVSASHLGDATGETAGWYSDLVGFADSSFPWFMRGGIAHIGSNAGVFNFSSHTGIGAEDYSFHTVLSIIK